MWTGLCVLADLSPAPAALGEFGHASLEVALFRWDEIPWEEIAFPSVHWALRDYRSLRHATAFAPRGNPDGASGDL